VLETSTWLDLLFWRYCHCKISAFWLENAYSGQFLAVLGDFNPLKLWYCCSNPQRNAIFPETRVLRHHSSKSVQRFDPQLRWRTNKKAQNINISPLRGGHAPEPIDMPFGVLSGVPDVITHAKFCVNRLRGLSAAAPRKVPFPISVAGSNPGHDTAWLFLR